MKTGYTCPTSGGACPHPTVCEALCSRVHHAPLDLIRANYRPALHFVGFRGEEYRRAVRVFGEPDFFHRGWDQRAQREIADLDTVVFAGRNAPGEPSPYSFDDSNQDDDPAAHERRGMR